MERRIFQLLYTRVRELGKTHSFKGKQFSDAIIVIVHLWAVLLERPTSWACRLENWPKDAWAALPSPSTMSRRLRTIGVLSLIEQVQSALSELLPSSLGKWIDSKPLAVSPYSKDRDARVGHGCGFAAKGYKIHVIVDAVSRRVDAWTLASMNRHESPIAQVLIDWLPKSSVAYLIGDNSYDTNPVHDKAAQKDCQLLAAPKPSAKGLGKRKHSPHRIHGRELLANPLKVVGQSQSFGTSMLQSRIGIEQSFGFWGNICCGLHGLPNWVRRPRRVALWIAGKLLIATAWRLLKKGLA